MNIKNQPDSGAVFARWLKRISPGNVHRRSLVDDLERFYGHLEQTLLATGFIRENHPGQVMNKLRRLFTRARPESQELNILRGILASIEQQNKGNKA
ncbi:hypothetical protein BY63_22600 [Escherichia coli O157:H7 str. K1795]|nr:hypothetical protein BY63_22600 [Escherichia coli O157:H7 str. K1795]